MQQRTLRPYHLCAMSDHSSPRTVVHRAGATRPRDDQAITLVQGSAIPQNAWQQIYPVASGRNSADGSNGSLPMTFDGQSCGLFAVDIVGFNGWQRDDDIQMHVHTSLYEIVQAAFDRSGVPWSACAHEDRGDGMLVVLPPAIPADALADPIPDRIRRLIRRYNRVSCEAARIKVRVAAHIGPVHHDGYGFVGRAICLLCRLLDASSFKRMLSDSGADVAIIASGYMYENVIRRSPSVIDPDLFRPLPVRVKETRTRAWAYIPGQLSSDTG